MDKKKFRKEVFEGMCTCAEEIHIAFVDVIRSRAIRILDQCPEPFKPGLSDKLIFNKILDNVVDTAWRDWNNTQKINRTMIGYNVMAKFYYPYYGNWMQAKKRKSINEYTKYLVSKWKVN